MPLPEFAPQLPSKEITRRARKLVGLKGSKKYFDSEKGHKVIVTTGWSGKFLGRRTKVLVIEKEETVPGNGHEKVHPSHGIEIISFPLVKGFRSRVTEIIEPLAVDVWGRLVVWENGMDNTEMLKNKVSQEPDSEPSTREYVEILDRDDLEIYETNTAEGRRYGNELDKRFRDEVHRLVDIGWGKIPPGTPIGGNQINVHFESPETKVTIDSRTKNHFIIYYNAIDQNRAKTFKVTSKGKILVSHYRKDKKKQRFTRATRFETNEITNRLHDLNETHYTS